MYLLMYNLLIDSIPAWLILVPLYFIGLLFMLTILFTLLGSTKKLKNSVSFQSITVGLSKFISRLLYGPFYKPLSQVLMIFSTNIKKNKNSFYFILILLFCSFGLFFVKSFDGNISYLMNQRIVFDTTKSRSSFYSSEQVSLTVCYMGLKTILRKITFIVSKIHISEYHFSCQHHRIEIKNREEILTRGCMK